MLQALHGQLRTAILEGRLASGLQLPATRALARQLKVSRNTVVATYDRLLSEGYVVSRPGAGTFVAQAARRKRARPSLSKADMRLSPAWRGAEPLLKPSNFAVTYNFRLGAPDLSLFPFDIWRRLMGSTIRSLSRAPVFYGNPAGLPELREAIAGHVSFARAVACVAEDVVVTSGAQQAFDLLARILVTPQKTVVAVENPGYPPTRAAFARAGAIIRGVPVDEEGLRVAELPRDVNVICVTPSHQFPLGVPLSPARRAALLDVAARQGAVIIEDDYDGEFRFEDRPLDALQTRDDHASVFYVGTFSKSLFPTLRQGFVVAPPWATEALVSARQLTDWYGPGIDQKSLAAFISQGHLARHVRRMRKVYETRRGLLMEAVAKHCAAYLAVLPSYAGMHVAVRLKRHASSSVIVARAADAGIAVLGIEPMAHAPPVMAGLVLGYALIPDELIDPGIRRLAQILRATRTRR
jgi:GntR family transcriptional regulator/MocR family aminotransferase